MVFSLTLPTPKKRMNPAITFIIKVAWIKICQGPILAG